MRMQEIQSLENFLNQLVHARGVAKDPQADRLIAGAVAQQPDAAYLLVQHALLMEQALNSAEAQIASLQGRLLQPAMPPQASQASAPSPGTFGGGFGGTLGTVAATAAGVAGGAFLFQGIEHMMHPGAASGLMNQSAASRTPPMGSTTVNNSYEADPPMTSGSALDFLATDGASWDDDSTLG